MKKQVTYAKFMPRLFSTAIDMIMLTFITMPIVRFIQYKFILWKFKAELIQHSVDATSLQSLFSAFQARTELQAYLTLDVMFLFLVINCATQAVIIGCYFVYFWSKHGSTLGKYVVGLRVVDEKTFEKMSVWQSTKRFLCCALYPISIVFIFFTSERQALHDKMSGAVVIKR